MKYNIILIAFLYLVEGFSIELGEIYEGVYTEKFPNSNKTMVLKKDLLLSIDERSFSIYKIKDNQFIKLSNLYLEGRLHSVDIYDYYAFVTTSSPVNRIYKIDISNVSLPITIDTLSISGSYTGFIYQDKYFVNKLSKNREWVLLEFDINNFNLLSEMKVPHHKWPVEKLNDKFLTLTSNEFIEIYKLQGNELLLIAKQPLNDLSFPYKTCMLNDSIFIHSCAIGGLRIFNVSNPFSWELITNLQIPISNFEIENDKLIVLNGGREISQYNISEITNPVLTQKISVDEITRDLELNGNNVYITCKEGKIYNYQISGNKITLRSETSHYGYLKDAILYKDNLILNTALGFTIQAQIIENEIRILDENNDNLLKRYLRNDKDNFISYSLLKNSDATKTNIGKILASGVSYYKKDVYNLPDNITVFDNYLIYLNMDYIRILNLEDSLSLVTEMRFSETREGRFYFYKGNIILIGNEQGFVFGFDESNSNIYLKGKFNTYSNYFSDIEFYKNYMLIAQSKGRSCDVYDISDINKIELFDVINYAGKLSVDKENGILFMGDITCKVFDINNIDNHDIIYLTKFTNHTSIVKLFTLQKNNNNFLLLVGETSVCLYSYHL